MLGWIRTLTGALAFRRKLRFQPQGKGFSRESDGLLKTVAAVQMDFESFRNVRDFYEKLLSAVRQAKSGGAQIVCFPAGMNLLLQPVTGDRMSKAQRQKVSGTSSRVFSDIAASEGVFLSEAETLDGTVVRRIWNPFGEKMEGPVFQIGGERVSFLGDGPEGIPDGVSLVLNPMLSSKWFNDYESFSHAWLRSQQECVYSVESCLVGASFSGKSGIYGPMEITDSRNGIIAAAKSEIFLDVVVSDLGFEELEELRRGRPKGYERLFADR